MSNFKFATKGRLWLTAAAIAVVVVVIVLLTLKFNPQESSSAGGVCTPTPTPVAGKDGINGLSAYDLWIAEGNTGTTDDFLNALVGAPGPSGYSGSNGISGSNGRAGHAGATGLTGEIGESGASAYQLWLDAGNVGTSQEFLAKLIGTNGADGLAGANGLSAYELWLAIGNTGDIAAFIDSLSGVDGTNGSDGSNGTNGLDGLNGADGISAYEIWVMNGHPGETVEAYLAALKGTPGVCTPGDTGKSAYELWLAEGNTGSIAEFLQSLKGEPGTGLPYNASFFDDTTQKNGSSPNLMRFNTADRWNNGIKTDEATNSRITFEHSGVYNIQFSTQFTKTDSGTDFISIWLRRNGRDVPMTNTELRSWGNDDRQVAAWNFFVEVREPGEYYELAWQTKDESIAMLSTPENGHPGIPSVILTVTQVY